MAPASCGRTRQIPSSRLGKSGLASTCEANSFCFIEVVWPADPLLPTRFDRAVSDDCVALPGDDLLPVARAQVTHHVDIDAPPAEVWPWLVQMGRRRAGWYSWDLLDNGGVESADRIIPALQQVAVGDLLPIKATGPDGFAILCLDPPRALVLGDPSLLPGRAKPGAAAPRATWAFALQPSGGASTRLVVRVRVEHRASLTAALLRRVVLIAHEVMERKQLRTLKQRVETERRRHLASGNAVANAAARSASHDGG
jgi:hypothetical protein